MSCLVTFFNIIGKFFIDNVGCSEGISIICFKFMEPNDLFITLIYERSKERNCM